MAAREVNGGFWQNPKSLKPVEIAACGPERKQRNVKIESNDEVLMIPVENASLGLLTQNRKKTESHLMEAGSDLDSEHTFSVGVVLPKTKARTKLHEAASCISRRGKRLKKRIQNPKILAPDENAASLYMGHVDTRETEKASWRNRDISFKVKLESSDDLYDRANEFLKEIRMHREKFCLMKKSGQDKINRTALIEDVLPKTKARSNRHNSRREKTRKEGIKTPKVLMPDETSAYNRNRDISSEVKVESSDDLDDRANKVLKALRLQKAKNCLMEQSGQHKTNHGGRDLSREHAVLIEDVKDRSECHISRRGKRQKKRIQNPKILAPDENAASLYMGHVDTREMEKASWRNRNISYKVTLESLDDPDLNDRAKEFLKEILMQREKSAQDKINRTVLIEDVLPKTKARSNRHNSREPAARSSRKTEIVDENSHQMDGKALPLFEVTRLYDSDDDVNSDMSGHMSYEGDMEGYF